MTACQACGRETNTYGELLPGHGVIVRCGHDDCRQPVDGSRLPSPNGRSIAEQPRAQAFEEDTVLSPLANARSAAPARPMLAPPAPVRVPSPMPAAPPSGARSLADQLPELRARRDSVKRTLAEMAALQREEAALDRMLAAADDPPN